MLAILTTHPIQYQAPLWQALARDGRVPFEVWYLSRHGLQPTQDREFNQTFAWDIDSMSGYSYRFLDVVAGATPAAFWKCRLRERLRDRLRDCGAVALWIQGWQVAAYWQAVSEANSVGIEVWLRGESNDLAPVPLWKRPVKRMQFGWLFRRISRFLYIGDANKRLYKKYGVREACLYPAPYAVDNERFANQAAVLKADRAEIRRKWGIPKNAFCALFCGKFVPKKHPMELVVAARQLRQSRALPDLHLLFVGSGALGDSLRRCCRVVFDVEPRNITESVAEESKPPASFTGFLSQLEISQAYSAADCLVLPSDHRETWGLVANEALASGIPCLISDACGCAEEAAFASGAYPFGDIGELASQLLKLSRRKTDPVAPPSYAQSIASIVAAYGDLVHSVSQSVSAADGYHVG